MLKPIDDKQISMLRRAVDIQAIGLAVRNISDEEIEEVNNFFAQYMSI